MDRKVEYKKEGWIEGLSIRKKERRWLEYGKDRRVEYKKEGWIERYNIKRKDGKGYNTRR